MIAHESSSPVVRLVESDHNSHLGRPITIFNACTSTLICAAKGDCLCLADQEGTQERGRIVLLSTESANHLSYSQVTQHCPRSSLEQI